MGNIWQTITTGTTSNLLYVNNTISYQPASMVYLPPTAIEASAKPEDPIAWLRRRVSEVCWTPPRVSA